MIPDDMTPEAALPYRRLCQAIIVQAIRDAAYPPADARRPNEAARNQSRALTWIETPNPDFNEVCEGAGFDPRTVRKHALEFIESGKPMPHHGKDRPARKRQPLSFGSIAARAGVSTSAASRALQEGFGSHELKRRVNVAVAEIQRELHA